MRNFPDGSVAVVQGATRGLGAAFVRHLLDSIIDGLHANDSGRFIAWDGRDIPW
ncbi:MAG TPA: hypothetical protein VKA32_07375 [Gammaproteobacteria bacterium]|nr:hypothetical protein [Gammaproteobacteria bacterium]